MALIFSEPMTSAVSIVPAAIRPSAIV